MNKTLCKEHFKFLHLRYLRDYRYFFIIVIKITFESLHIKKSIVIICIFRKKWNKIVFKILCKL
jgi:hypothetical protein